MNSKLGDDDEEEALTNEGVDQGVLRFVRSRRRRRRGRRDASVVGRCRGNWSSRGVSVKLDRLRSVVDDLVGKSNNLALQVTKTLGTTLLLLLRRSEQAGTPCGEVLFALLRRAFAHGALARRGRLLANRGLRIVARLEGIVLRRRKDRGMARSSGGRVRGSIRVGSRTLAADSGRHQCEPTVGVGVAGREMRFAKHRLLEGSGVGGEVETIELDIVSDGYSDTVDDHGWSERAKGLHGGQAG